MKFIKSKTAPNPVEARYWVDLSADKYGKIMKFWNGSGWEGLSSESSSDTKNDYMLIVTNNKIAVDAAQKVLDTYNTGGEIYVKYSTAENLYKPSKIQVEGNTITLYLSNYNESIGNNYTVLSITVGQTTIDTYGKKIVNITDNLTSQSSDMALSSKQGKILNDALVALSARVTALETA